VSTQDLLSILKDGGCSGVTASRLVSTIGQMSKTGLVLNNRFNNKRYLCFSAAPDFTCPKKEQLKREPRLPQIPKRYFLASGTVTTEDACLTDGSQSQQPDETAVERTVETTVNTTMDETAVEVSEGQPRPRQGFKLVDIDIEESFFELI
jgi:hypothetical protein